MAKSVAASENREVLHDDGVRERAKDLGRGDSRFHQVHDVGLGENAALGRDVVELAGFPRRGGRASPFPSPTLSMHLSMVAPVPEAHLSFMDATARLSPLLRSPCR